ncbi:MAG: DNA repair protein RecO [Planctomycetes bacterium]|nr:DNA repair protein RecO [Planctomycetota bacterium]
MAAEKSLALVLRTVDFSETSLVVTLFTREFGKIGALAKGARRPKSAFEGALDLLSLCRVVFLHKSSDALDLLTEAKLHRRFRAGARDLTRLYAGYYVAELLDELTHTGDPHPELYDAAVAALADLDGEGNVAAITLRMEMTALRVLGHAPSLAECVGCGIPVAPEERVAFGMLEGGVLCPECRPGKRQVVSVSGEVVKTLRRYADATSDAWRGSPPGAKTWGELRGALNHYLANLLGKKPKLHDFLGSLAKEPPRSGQGCP